jgi:hypothetical protein
MKEVICEECKKKTTHIAFVDKKMVCQRCFAKLTRDRRRRVYKIYATEEEASRWNLIRIRARICDKGHASSHGSFLRIIANNNINSQEEEQ